MLVIDSLGQPHIEDPALQRHMAGLSGRWKLVPIPADQLVFCPIRQTSDPGYLSLMGCAKRAGDIADLATLIQGARWTGSLEVAGPRFTKAVEFEFGDVTGVRSDAAEDRLGQVLCQLGFIDSCTLQQALEAPDRRQKLGARLVWAGKLSQHQLCRALHQQIAQVFQSLLLLDNAHYAFVRASAPPTRSTGLRVPTQQLLLTGLQRLDELKCFRERIPSSLAVFEQVGRAVGLRLESMERKVLDLIDGIRPLAEVARLLHLDEYEVTRAAFRLVQVGIIGLIELPAPSRRGNDLGRGASVVLGAFNPVFVELFESHPGEGLRQSALSYLEARSGEFGALLDGVELHADGSLDPKRFQANLKQVPQSDQAEMADQCLNEYLFFLTFAANESLDLQAEVALRRVE